MFPVSSHTAEKVQQDINAIVQAIAQWLSKVKLALPTLKQEAELPPASWTAELDPENSIDLEAIQELQALPRYDPSLLAGKETLRLAPVQLQIGTTQIAGLLPEIREQLDQLPPEQIADLRHAVEQSTGTQEPSGIINIQVDASTVLHRNEQGQMEINELQPMLETNPSHSQQGESIELNSASENVQRTSKESMSVHSGYPYVELRPVAEVEVLTGQELGSSSTIHEQVIQQAPSVLVTVDDQGQTKPSAYLREQVEATEDAVKATIESGQNQPLTPEAIAVVETLQTHFAETGKQELICSDYTFKSVGNHLCIISHENPEEVAVIQGEYVIPSIELKHYQELMQRFTSAYEQIQISPHEETYEYGNEYQLE